MRDAENGQSAEVVEMVQPYDELARWHPAVGEETLALVEGLRLPADDTEGRDRLVSEAVSTLARCRPPGSPEGHETGLVIGYVQSGKTTSFTTVSALARDNSYRLVIICTGLTVSLFDQSRARLERDLRLSERTDRLWMFLANPRPTPHVEQMVETALDDPNRTILIAVMKNGRHLDNLRRLLQRPVLRAVPALIIDDEADQATLNNFVRQGNESATYRRILDLRSLLSHHTFLQYTATPQAPLLINLIDLLSPNFAEVLTPGLTYTGGRSFFEGDMELIREIPIGDIPTAQNVLQGAPRSLLTAMRLFWVGVAEGLLRDEGQGNRSMMIHPSQRVPPHADYHQWVLAVKALWEGILASDPSDPDRQELVVAFQEAHEDLARTVPDLPAFDAVLSRLRDAIRQTIVTQVNAARGRTPQPDWRQFYAHIVIGGEVLNRGVTLEGLTVTYMPRGPGTGQADTIQQRARWFGYKADYLGYCRVYLSNQMRNVYQAYVRHEDLLRAQLQQHRATGGELRDWRRAFFLDPSLRPTRDSVVDLALVRGNFADSWFDPKAPHDPEAALPANREIVRRFVESIDDAFHPDDGHPRRTDAQIHLTSHEVSLQLAHSGLLTQLHMARPNDSIQLAGLLLQIATYLEDHPDEVCSVYQMSQGQTRDRTLGDQGEIPTLFQGANYDESVNPRITLYPGDSRIHSDNLTIQLHTLRLKTGNSVVADNVPAVAVWVPRRMSGPWVTQARR